MADHRLGSMPDLTELAHESVRRAVTVLAREKAEKSFFVVDATAGNGHDTLFLARTVDQSGAAGACVLAFDIQATALDRVRQRLTGADVKVPVYLFHEGHEYLEERVSCLIHEKKIPERLAAIVFNLGFLPGSNKLIITRPDTTLAALGAAIRLLSPHGIMTVHMYSGHVGGGEECLAVLDFVSHLAWDTWRVLSLEQCNKTRNREWLIIAERLSEK